MSLIKIFVLIAITAFCFYCIADTFTQHKTGKFLHGYPTSITENDQTIIYTIQQGFTSVNLEKWDIQYGRLGRSQKVVIIEIEEDVRLKIVTQAVQKAIIDSADDGPIFIIIEINSSGGDTEKIENICDTIIRTDNCPIYGFIKAGKHGGAIGSTAAIALACDKLYMEPETIIGAASITNEINGNLSIAWQQYLQSLAKLNGKPDLLARAMVDKDISVIEIEKDNERKFITSNQQEPNQVLVKQWSKKGLLLTLTANEAAQSGIADGITSSRDQLLRELHASDVKVVNDEKVPQAAATFKKVKMKFDRLRESLDGQIKKAEKTDNIAEAVILLKKIKDDYKSLLLLARRFEDLSLDVELIEEQIDHAKAYYEKAKDKQRRLDSNSPFTQRQNAEVKKNTFKNNPNRD